MSMDPIQMPTLPEFKTEHRVVIILIMISQDSPVVRRRKHSDAFSIMSHFIAFIFDFMTSYNIVKTIHF